MRYFPSLFSCQNTIYWQALQAQKPVPYLLDSAGCCCRKRGVLLVTGGKKVCVLAARVFDGLTEDSPVSMDLMSGKPLSKVSTASISPGSSTSCVLMRRCPYSEGGSVRLCCQGLGCCSPTAPSAWAGLQPPSCRSPASS